jgi:secondary thiamine-phosphate synthase enzyme
VKGLLAEISVRTSQHTEFVSIDDVLEHTIAESGWKDGALVVYCPHTTAAVTVNEGYDPRLLDDFVQCLERMVPWRGHYRHEDDNTAAHVKAMLVGSSVTLLVEDGKLDLGRWQTVFFCEFDGPRSRRLRLQFRPLSL